MAEITEGRFKAGFVPDARLVNAMFGLLVGEAESPANWDSGDGLIQVEYEWIAKNIPAPSEVCWDLVKHGLAVHHAYDSDDSETFAVSWNASEWLAENHGLPCQGDDEDDEEYEDRRAAWVAKHIVPKFKRKAVRAPGAKRAKPVGPMVARTVSRFVPKISFTPEEAAQAHAVIQEAYDRGNLTERQQAGLKAVVTRRVAA